MVKLPTITHVYRWSQTSLHTYAPSIRDVIEVMIKCMVLGQKSFAYGEHHSNRDGVFFLIKNLIVGEVVNETIILYRCRRKMVYVANSVSFRLFSLFLPLTGYHPVDRQLQMSAI